jgi:hypothetical protein
LKIHTAATKRREEVVENSRSKVSILKFNRGETLVEETRSDRLYPESEPAASFHHLAKKI